MGWAAWIALSATAASCTLIGGLDKTYKQCGPGEEPTKAGCVGAGGGGGTGGTGTSSSTSSSSGGSDAGCAGKPVVCDDACVDTQTDVNHCGGCDQWCPTGASCASGKCEACSGTEKVCVGACRDYRTDPDHCGACDVSCAVNGTCTVGACGCAAGATLCACPAQDPTCTDACADLSSDARHCGACGTACEANEICENSGCKCPANRTVCGSACTDVDTDLNHCGQCSSPCLASEACIDGKCVEPELIATTELVTSLAVDATGLYWTIANESDPPHGMVMRRPHDGSGELTLASDENDPGPVVLDGKGNVYWASVGASGDDVKTAPIVPGAKKTLATQQQDVSGLASDGKAVFWTTFDDAKVWSLSLTAPSTPTPLATQQTTVAGLVMDAKYLYWSCQNGGWIAQMPKTGGEVIHIVDYMGDDPARVAVNDKTLYWLSNNGGIGKVPIGGGTATFWKSPVAFTARGIKADATSVYWIENDAQVLHRSSPDLGTTVTMARTSGMRYPLAIDDVYVYFGTADGIYRVPKHVP